MDRIKEVYIYRHGETDWNVSQRTMGQLESIVTSFTKLGYEEIEDISIDMIKNNIEVIYSSDLQRAVETATIANNNKNVAIYMSKELRGLNMGQLQGLSTSELENSKFAQESFKNYDIPLPGGESINDLNRRVYSFIKRICDETDYERIAIVTHSAVMSNLRSFLDNDNYVSINRCLLLYKDGKFIVKSYDTVGTDKPFVMKRGANENK